MSGAMPMTVFAFRSPKQRKALVELRGATLHPPAHLPTGVPLWFSRRTPLGACNLLLDVFADHTLRSLPERKLIRQAAFEKHTDTGMPQRIGCRDQSDVTPSLQV